MIKNNMKYTAIRIIAVVFLANVILITLYCNYFLNKSISSGINKTKKEVNNNLITITKILKDETKLNKASLKNISKKYNVEITLKDNNQNIIFTNIKDHNFDYITQEMLTVGNKTYLLVISKQLDISVSGIIKKLLLIELLIILLISSVIIYIVNKRLLRPIVYLRYDMSTYKNGIIPKKRKKKEDLYGIHEHFVNLTHALEEEKEKHNRVIASISHDIKTPLTAILGYTSRIENAKLTNEMKEKYIAKIGSKALSIKEIMDEFDDYLSSSLTSTLHKEQISTKDLFKMLETDYLEDLEDRNIKLRLQNNAKKDNIVLDLNKIKRVFSNIISNSTRHIKEEKGQITITLSKKEDYYEFTISDSGEGVKEENLHKIFDPLYTTDSSRKISGLGLSICKQIIKLHEGEIFAKNNKEKGLAITFTIKNN